MTQSIYIIDTWNNNKKEFNTELETNSYLEADLKANLLREEGKHGLVTKITTTTIVVDLGYTKKHEVKRSSDIVKNF